MSLRRTTGKMARIVGHEAAGVIFDVVRVLLKWVMILLLAVVVAAGIHSIAEMLLR